MTGHTAPSIADGCDVSEQADSAASPQYDEMQREETTTGDNRCGPSNSARAPGNAGLHQVGWVTD